MTASIAYKTEPTGAEEPAKEINAEAGANNENKTVENNGSTERPSWLPENFKTVDDFVKSATDSRAEVTRLQQELAKVKKPEDKPTEGDNKEAPKTDDDAAKALEQSGVDNTPYQQEFDETGDLSPEARAKAVKEYEPFIKKMFGEKADPEAIVNQWIEGQQLRSSNYRNSLFSAAGGEEEYGKMLAWAKTNFQPAEKEAFNKATASGDINAARQAVDSLAARYGKANGNPPKLLGGGPGGSSSQGFASTYEMQQAIRDPRYKADPIYRKSVEERIGKSNF